MDVFDVSYFLLNVMLDLNLSQLVGRFKLLQMTLAVNFTLKQNFTSFVMSRHVCLFDMA